MSEQKRGWRKFETLGTFMVAAGLLCALPAGFWHGYAERAVTPADWIVDFVTYSAAILVLGGLGLNVFSRTRQTWNE